MFKSIKKEWDWQVEIEKFLEDPAFKRNSINLIPKYVYCGKQKEFCRGITKRYQ